MPMFYEVPTGSDIPTVPSALVSSCIEGGFDALLIDSSQLPREFFDLSTGVAGAFVHKLTQYHIRLAVVLQSSAQYSLPFQDFVREANRGSQFRFLSTRAEAVEWLGR